MASPFFKLKALELKDEMISWRRDFHQHPELGYQEERTSKIIAERMRDWGYKVQMGIAKTGVVACLKGRTPGPTVLLRFEMDALPIQELNTAPYASDHPGIMHACGHDGHMAIGLAVGRILSQQREQLRGEVKIVFQPAEEILGGAQRMVKEGILENPKPDFSLAAHLWNEKALGWIGISAGPLLAGADTLEITVRGQGGHGAIPNESHDPIVASAHLITALQSIIARNVDPRKSGVVSITQISAGDTFNVIPEKVLLRGTIRTFETGTKELIQKRIEAISTEVAAAFECEAEVKIHQVAPPVVNDIELAKTAKSVVEEIFPEVVLATNIRSMVSEDMAYMMETVPGCYLLIGSNKVDGENYAVHHSPFFDFDENALPYGAAILAAIAWRILETR